MVTIEQMTGLIALSKTLFDASKGAIDFVQTLAKYRADKATVEEAQRAAALMSTYDEGEIASLEERLKNCRKIFQEEGTGTARVQCICNVFKHAKDGNGGDLPPIEIWEKMDKQLKCAEFEQQKARHA